MVLRIGRQPLSTHSIYSSMTRGEGDDQLVWRLTTFGVFDVRSFYKLLASPTTDAFPWEDIWHTNG